MDIQSTLEIIKAADRDPVKLCFAQIDISFSHLTNYQRDSLKKALKIASIPHWFNEEILKSTFDIPYEDVSEIFVNLSKLSIVETFQARGNQTFNIHEKSRLILRRYLHDHDFIFFRQVSKQLSAHFVKNTSPESRIEYVYHQLAAKEPTAADELELLYRNFVADSKSEKRLALVGVLEELEQNLGLDPVARAVSLCCIGFSCLRRSDTTNIEYYAETALSLAREANSPRIEAEAMCLAGDIAFKKGEVQKSKTAYNHFSLMFERLASQEPSNSLWLRELSISKVKLGHLFESTGEFAKAKDHFIQAITIMESMGLSEIARIGFSLELGMNYGCLAEIHRELREFDESLRMINIAIKKVEAIIDETNREHTRDLGILYGWKGNTLSKLNRKNEALLEYEKEIHLFNNLINHDPSNLDYLAQHAVSLVNVADLITPTSEANKLYQKYLETFTNLCQIDPSNVRWARELAIANWRVSKIHQRKGHKIEAKKYAKKGIQIFTRIHSENPELLDIAKALKDIKYYKTQLTIN